ncbi:MAG: hypothetical protein ABIG99_00525 [Patescibacteria group bacterium]
MIKEKIQKNKGFVILFAVTISAILLSITLGVSNIAFREIKFSTNARYTNDAFFAADTGAEHALFNEKSTGTFCEDMTSCDFVFTGLGNNGQACALVTINKTDSTYVTVISRGYSIGDSPTCNSANPNRVERRLEVTYLK